MRLDSTEITAIATELAPLVADILEQRLSARPELAMSISEAAASGLLYLVRHFTFPGPGKVRPHDPVT